MVLGSFSGLIVIDEIQTKPELFRVLRVLADRLENKTHFLILGSASTDIIRNVSESMAGRVEFVELHGFDLSEVGFDSWQSLWLRGGFPRSYLAKSDDDSVVWREGFIRTFLERDIPQLGIQIPASAMRRFWTIIAYNNAKLWNASDYSRTLGLSDKSVRFYLDILTGSFMMRQLLSWHVNISKRQVKAPKVYLRDTGLLHSLLGINSFDALLSHPQLGFSWEGFVIEQILRILNLPSAYFWATHSGAELDLYIELNGRKFGFKCEFNEAPAVTKSMRIAAGDLSLDHLWVIYPGKHTYPAEKGITMLPIQNLSDLPTLISYL